MLFVGWSFLIIPGYWGFFSPTSLCVALLSQVLCCVVYVLFSKHLQEALLDDGVLEAFTEWLQPLGDGSRPNATLRGEVFRLISTVSEGMGVDSVCVRLAAQRHA